MHASVALDRLKGLRDLLGSDGAGDEQMRPADDGVERGAQLVAHGRQELVFGLVCPIGRVERARSLGGRLLELRHRSLFLETQQHLRRHVERPDQHAFDGTLRIAQRRVDIVEVPIRERALRADRHARELLAPLVRDATPQHFVQIAEEGLVLERRHGLREGRPTTSGELPQARKILGLASSIECSAL